MRNKDVFGLDVVKRKPTNDSPLKQRLHEIIFEAETKEGKLFDIVLVIMIFLSIIVLMMESVPSINAEYGTVLRTFEYILTAFFTIEYGLRIYSVYKPRNYIFSFFGIIDFLSILPVYLTWLVPGMQSLLIIRGLRILRIFRIFKLDTFVLQGNFIINAFYESRRKILIFAMTILLLVGIFGSLMYLIEHKVNPGFESIPRSIYWAIVTITTVGYGDISPMTSAGQFLASLIMLMGYVMIAVPTGIVTTQFMDAKKAVNTITCPKCTKEGHDEKAGYCNRCGHELYSGPSPK
jgi:voltage-gated potassium channel